jgi:hypothetical protein
LAYTFRPSASTPVTINATPVASTTPASRPIETLRVGQRVATYSVDEASSETRVDPATWRLLRLSATTTWGDGTLDVTTVETLQPPSWVKLAGANVGAMVPLPLDLVEMGLPAEMRAEVIANEPCPQLERGSGRVVLTTVNHLNNDVYELTVGSLGGQSEVIRTTGFHKFYRQGDDAWVSAKELSAGDRLDGPTATLVVQSLQPLPGTHRVYNLTVEGDHVYRVSTLGVLVHNNGCAQQGPLPLTDEQALRQSLASRYAHVDPSDLRGARPHGTNGRPGHPNAHGMNYADHVNNINNAERRFIGVNRNGRPVNIFYRAGNVTITEADDVTRIITGYGQDFTKAVDPSRWTNDPLFHEIVF